MVTMETPNRLKVGVARTKANMNKWGFNREDDTCDCGERQINGHLLSCIMSPAQCTKEDLILTNTNAQQVAAYWSQHNVLNVTKTCDFIRRTKLIN